MWGLSTWIPTILPRRKLEREILNIFIADLLTKSEGSVDNMPEDDVNEVGMIVWTVCYVRMLVQC